MAPGLHPEGGPPAGARDSGAGPADEGSPSRPQGGHSGRPGPGPHGPHGYPLRLLGERRGRPPHRDSEKCRTEAFLRPLPREVQQQDQRRHLPPVAGGLQPGAGRPDRQLHRPRLAAGRQKAGKAAGVPGGRGRSGPAAGGEAAQQGPAVPGALGQAAHRNRPPVGFRYPGEAPPRV